MARGGCFSSKTSNLREKKFFLFYCIYFFGCYYCSINPKRQSEHSGLLPDTSSLVSFVEKEPTLSNSKNRKVSENMIEFKF